MKSIRVLVAIRPRLFRELVIATITDQPDIELVGQIEEESRLEEAVVQTEPDFLIVGLDSEDRLPDPCPGVLQNHPKVKIIGIATDRNSTMFYWTSLRVQSNEIEASEAGVLNALRGISKPSGRPQ
jgi:hypothetical protein